MKNRLTGNKCLSAGFLVCMLAVGTATATGQAFSPVNNSHDPFEAYGGCVSNYSGYANKTWTFHAVGGTLGNVTAIDVIDCRFFDSGPTSVVPCPPKSPYAYCITNHNDGESNLITLGVMKLTKANDPLLSYGGCAPGAGFRLKRNLLFEAGRPFRNVDNIVIIDCHAADGAGGTHQVSCPAGRNPYAYCLQNHNDGVGNSVLVGVVNSYSAGDPYGVYGHCTTNSGYRSKASLVTEAGRSLNEVVAINVLFCGNGSYYPQQKPQIAACSQYAAFPGGYGYCLTTDNDGKGNSVQIGVITNIP